MSSRSLDDGYEAFAPQWTDFSEITPNRNVGDDDYFDRIHDNLEAMSNKNSEKHRRNRWRENVNMQTSGHSSILLDTPKNLKFHESEIQSTFMEEIDNIHMTPVKVTSPRSRNKEPIILQELSVNEVLSNAMRGLEIATTKPKSCRKSQILNATICPSSTTNSKVTSSQRKVRISRSMYFQSPNLSTARTPAAKAAVIPRSVNRPKCKVPLIVVEPEQSFQFSSCETVSDVGEKIQNIDDNSNIFGNSTRFKPPTKSSKSLRSTTPTTRSITQKTNDLPKCVKTPKTPKLKLTMETSEPESVVDHTIVENTVPEKQMECKGMNEATVEQNSEISLQSGNQNSPADRIILDSSIKDGEDETIRDETVIQSRVNDIEIGQDSNNHTDVDYEEIFEVHRNDHVEHRTYRHGKATLVTNPARRRSSIANRRRRSNKYISLAEAVSTFQRSTPTRFHTVSSKCGPVQRIKQASIRTTIPVSPALKSKTRVRKHAVLSQTEREELELKDMREHQIHANPIRPEILKAPETLKSVAKKPITVPKPFKLSGKPKSSQPTASTSSASSSSDPICHSTSARIKRVITLAPSSDSQSVEQQEIRNFGIPIMRNFNEKQNDNKKKVTRPQPFSIEERQKQFLNKREEKLKLLQNEEAKKNKFEFHARPVPSAVKKSSVNTSKDKAQKALTSHVQVIPFSFEERNKITAKKKEELRKKIEEEERKARIFHANPVPTFKPVVVRSVSRENLRTASKTQSTENMKSDGKGDNIVNSNDNLTTLTRGKSADCLKPSMKFNTRNQSADNLKVMKRVQSHDNIRTQLLKSDPQKSSVAQMNNQENVAPNVQRSHNPSTMPTLKPKLKTLPIELHSDKRARIRREYDGKMRMKLEQEEERRKKEQESRLAREKAEIVEIRKKAEVKARPMPSYKPLIPAKSTKPLTEAESPAWAKKKH